MHSSSWCRTAPEKRDQAKAAASVNASERLIDILDRHLAKCDYVAGRAFTMGDIPVGLQIHRWLGMGVSGVPRPNVEAWYARLRARPRAQDMLTLPVS
jgi:glutathione S-transferase